MSNLTALRLFPQGREKICGCVYLPDTHEFVFACDGHDPRLLDKQAELQDVKADLLAKQWELKTAEWKEDEAKRAV